VTVEETFHISDEEDVMHRQSRSRNLAFHRVLTIAVAATLGALAPVGSASAYTHQTLHSFCNWANCGDGEHPNGLLQDAAGDLYGSTQLGGGHGKGAVFKLIPNADKSKYSEHRIYSFCKKASCKDGAQPFGDLIKDVEGNLYGTTFAGGNSDSGVIFKLAPVGNGWKYTVWHSFCAGNCADGSVPFAGLTYPGEASDAPWDEVSPLFGTTESGGLGNGVVYEITTSPHLLYSVIHKFGSSSNPQPVLADASGTVFGTMSSGGKYSGGLLYKLVPNGNGTWKEITLHNFCAEPNCTDGDFPQGKLFIESAGNVFGTTVFGGANTICNDNLGCGVVFEYPAGGGYNVAYNFCSLANCADGYSPQAGLATDAAGNLFGTTETGGADSQKGVVFELAPGGAESVLYEFCPEGDPCPNGAAPFTPLILDSQGDVFGTTFVGGANGQFGTVFDLKP
jgi:uncharacterized repeat protein (TIGR03803 family)